MRPGHATLFSGRYPLPPINERDTFISPLRCSRYSTSHNVHAHRISATRYVGKGQQYTHPTSSRLIDKDVHGIDDKHPEDTLLSRGAKSTR